MNPFNTRFFRHYKNKPYRYIGLVRHSETLEEMALYETLYENKLGKMWVRPKDMFFESINIEGQSQRRFQPVEFIFKSYSNFTSETLNSFKEICRAGFKSYFEEEKYVSKIEFHKNFHILIAYDENKPVGIKIGYLLDQRRFYSWLGAVMPDYQGLGIASELMRLQHQWCAQNNIEIIETRTRSHFRQMISLNLAHGFEIVGSLKDKKGLKIILEKKLSS